MQCGRSSTIHADLPGQQSHSCQSNGEFRLSKTVKLLV